jgi:hypothetical protein
MYQVTVDYAKKNLDELCDRALSTGQKVAKVDRKGFYKR